MLEEYIEIVYPDDIEEAVTVLSDESKENIKLLFDFYAADIPNCGELVFSFKEFSEMKDEVDKLYSEQERKVFANLFFELNLVTFG